jgi:hypothetical protein
MNQYEDKMTEINKFFRKETTSVTKIIYRNVLVDLYRIYLWSSNYEFQICVILIIMFSL